ncbi:MAG TPA: TetR/AcrR family transcriptional regulator [Bryobacteraceae bacterium]|nr:TetR/AcrR family transcriptional regulator [Bryobacteraceae bacterium]
MLETKQKLLDAAESLIAEQGYAATSLRHIIAKAGVNLASIHYHFGSKEELLDELITCKVGPINQERLERLDRAWAEAAPALPRTDAILGAFMLPMARAAANNPQFVKVMGRIMAEGLLPAVVEKHFMPTAGRFIETLRNLLPELPETEFQWRIHFMVGAISHTMCNSAAAPADFETRIRYLIRFVNAGLCAPAVHKAEVTA